ncbi:MAG: nitroreductase family deazaflavin-dependent oxidoreductase [Chloroflexi bacterium]|nr:MAG: nitroreductase family deazaflavin-dependent oxidoreductase [Chloroflexota bacterium]
MSTEPSAQRPGPVEIPSDMKAFNRKLIEEFRANRGQLSGQMAGRKLLVLTTTGAKSGQPRSIVLGFGRDGDHYVTIASGNGAPTHPSWYLNLQANSAATVEVGPEKLAMRARTARKEERERLTGFVPYLVSQQKLTSREIPIVIFEPAQT